MPTYILIENACSMYCGFKSSYIDMQHDHIYCYIGVQCLIHIGQVILFVSVDPWAPVPAHGITITYFCSVLDFHSPYTRYYILYKI